MNEARKSRKYKRGMRMNKDDNGEIFCPFCHSYEFHSVSIQEDKEMFQCDDPECKAVFSVKAYPRKFMTPSMRELKDG